MSVENRGLVLVAEDEKPIADLIGMYLRRDGFGVHAVATGSEALAAARRLHPVAMILDVGLPDEVIVNIAPVTLGSGKPLLPRHAKLRCLETMASGEFIAARYEVAR